MADPVTTEDSDIDQATTSGNSEPAKPESNEIKIREPFTIGGEQRIVYDISADKGNKRTYGWKIHEGSTVEIAGSGLGVFNRVNLLIDNAVYTHIVQPSDNGRLLTFTVTDEIKNLYQDGARITLQFVDSYNSGNSRYLVEKFRYGEEGKEDDKEAAKKAQEAQEKAQQMQGAQGGVNLGPAGLALGAAEEVVTGIGRVLTPNFLLKDNNRKSLKEALVKGSKEDIKKAIEEAKRLGDTDGLKEALKLTKNKEHIELLQSAISQGSAVKTELGKTVETTSTVRAADYDGGGGGAASVEQTVTGTTDAQAGAKVKLEQEVSGGVSAKVEGQEQVTTSVSGGAAGGSVSSESTVQTGGASSVSGSATGQQEVRQKTKIQATGGEGSEAEVSAKAQTSAASASTAAAGSAQVTSTTSGQGQASRKVEASGQQKTEVSQQPSAEQKPSTTGQAETAANVKTNAELAAEYDEKYKKQQEAKKSQESKLSGEAEVKSTAPLSGPGAQAPSGAITKTTPTQGKGATIASIDGISKTGVSEQKPAGGSGAKSNLSAKEKSPEPVKPQKPLQVSAAMDGVSSQPPSAAQEVLMRLRSKEKQSGAQLNAKNLGRNAVELDKQHPAGEVESGGFGENGNQKSGLRPEQDRGVKIQPEPLRDQQAVGSPETESQPSGDKSFKMPDASENDSGAGSGIPKAAARNGEGNENRDKKPEPPEAGQEPETQPDGGDDGGDGGDIPGETEGPSGAADAEKSKAIKEAIRLVNPEMNALLIDGAIWVWSLAIPSFGLSVVIGAIIGDLLAAFKKALIRKALNSVLLPQTIVGKGVSAEEISDQIKFSSGVKANIAAMNLVVVGLIFAVILSIGALIYIGCNWPTGMASGATGYKFSVMGLAGYSDLCKVVTSAPFGSSNMLNGIGPDSVAYTPPAGSCMPVVAGPASPGQLSTTCFGNNATTASIIAGHESGGNTASASGVDYCRDANNNPVPYTGKYSNLTRKVNGQQILSVSWGLFQINLTANKMYLPDGTILNCPSAVGPLYTAKQQQCTIKDPALFDRCVAAALDSQTIINTACIMSKNGTTWGPWQADIRDCHL